MIWNVIVKDFFLSIDIIYCFVPLHASWPLRKSEGKTATQKSGTNIEEGAKVRVPMGRMNVSLLNINHKNNNDTT